MAQTYENVGRLGQDWIDSSLQSAAAWSKGMQAITIEANDYSKKALENGSAVVEKLLSTSSLDKAFEVQADYLREAYEGFVAEAAKMGDLYATTARDACKPFEAVVTGSK